MRVKEGLFLTGSQKSPELGEKTEKNSRNGATELLGYWIVWTKDRNSFGGSSVKACTVRGACSQ